ncbi:MAG TPA: hypothetical protein VI456_09090 [Polyangia bacterium]
MRSRLLLCAALAGSCLFGSWSPVAHAADPKTKKAKTSDSDDKVIDKQMQWEDSVMGPDDKRAELDKIARAQAINKAAAEKAAKEKDKADAQAAREKDKADAAPKTSKRGGEVALPTLSDEDSGKGKNGKSSEISPKLETTAAAAPPPPVKHGDDKFLDKLLKDDGGSKKHKASASEDKALDDLLAVEKPKAGPAKGKKKGDDVDSLLSSADKAPPMPETHVKHETPEWAKPEISSTPVEAPMPLRPQPKRNDGIIHVTQGAASSVAAAPATTTRRASAAAPPAPVRTSTVATRGAAGRRQTAPASGNWNDPFAARAPKKTVAAREARSDSGADDLDNLTPVNRRRAPSPARSDDDDSFTNAKATAGTRRAVPAAKPKWKDPFTSSAAPAPAPARAKVATRSPAPAAATGRTTVASREPQKGESSKWDVATRHSASAAESPAQGRSDRNARWGVLKKHAH